MTMIYVGASVAMRDVADRRPSWPVRACAVRACGARLDSAFAGDMLQADSERDQRAANRSKPARARSAAAAPPCPAHDRARSAPGAAAGTAPCPCARSPPSARAVSACQGSAAQSIVARDRAPPRPGNRASAGSRSTAIGPSITCHQSAASATRHQVRPHRLPRRRAHPRGQAAPRPRRTSAGGRSAR